MYTISLTSIPPRFSRLRPVLNSLLAQDPAPDQVILCLPRMFRRFPGAVTAPDLPQGVTLMWSEVDLGPATKVLPAARALAGACDTLIYCDDDWVMTPHWASKLMTAKSSTCAATGAGYGIDRLGRVSQASTRRVDIAQGFAGVAIRPTWLAGADLDPPSDAWAVDDIWLSGHLARQGIAIRQVPEARQEMQLAFDDDHGLQVSDLNGVNRDQANRACARLLHDRYGIWPARP